MNTTPINYPMPVEEFIRELVKEEKRGEMHAYAMVELEKAKRGRIVAPENLIPLYKAIYDINVEMAEINERAARRRKRAERAKQS